MRLSKHFDSKEFDCRCGCGKNLTSPLLVEELEKLRKILLGRSIHVNSGTRCKEYNKKVGGKQHSQHLLGTAADIVVAGIVPSAVHSTLLHLFPNKYGIGKYASFTHFDVRASKARW